VGSISLKYPVIVTMHGQVNTKARFLILPGRYSTPQFLILLNRNASLHESLVRWPPQSNKPRKLDAASRRGAATYAGPTLINGACFGFLSVGGAGRRRWWRRRAAARARRRDDRLAGSLPRQCAGEQPRDRFAGGTLAFLFCEKCAWMGVLDDAIVLVLSGISSVGGGSCVETSGFATSSSSLDLCQIDSGAAFT